MKKMVAALVCLGLLSGVAVAQSNIQLFFSESGASPGAPENPMVNTQTNPGPTTLYLWAGFDPAADIWNGLGIYVETTGDINATVGSTHQVSYFGGAFSRWQTSPSQPYDPVWTMGPRGFGHNAAAVTSQGLNNPFDQDLKVNGYLLVGEVTFEGTQGDVYLGVSDGKITRRDGNPGTDTVTFGVGDPPVIANVPGNTSATADATFFIPEPASLLLLGLAGMALRRR